MDGFKRRNPNQPGPTRPTPVVLNNEPKVEKPLPQETLVNELPPPAVDETPDSNIKIATTVKKRRLWPIVLGVIVTVLLVAGAGGFLWYQQQLKPLDAANDNEQDVIIKPGTSYGFVASRLKERGLIRSELAFNVYGVLSGKNSQLKEGTCKIKPSEAVAEIVDKLTSGCRDFKSITFYPGSTIERPLYKPDHAELDQSINIKGVLTSAGYSEAEIKAALAKSYNSPLFVDKPAGSSLEGYIYGETYHVDTDASVESILQTTFDHMYKEVEPLIPEFKKQNLNLHEAITLASIVQRELNCEGKTPEDRKQRCHEYQRQIAQVFHKRLAEGISLGADVTFIYAADQMGVPPTIDLDSPYNTRIHTGLTPGPIGSPGISALKAVANPSDTDYLFFVAGDDGLIYFGKTQAEHEENIRNHCQLRCTL